MRVLRFTFLNKRAIPVALALDTTRVYVAAPIAIYQACPRLILDTIKLRWVKPEPRAVGWCYNIHGRSKELAKFHVLLCLLILHGLNIFLMIRSRM